MFPKNWDTFVTIASNKWTAVVNAIVEPFKSLYNTIASYIDPAINKINSMTGLSIPKMGLIDTNNTVSQGAAIINKNFNIGSVDPTNFEWPGEHAKGGVFNSPQLGIIGEAGPEIVVPLENTSFVDKLASAVGTAVMGAMQFSQSSGGQSDREVIMNIDSREIARALLPAIDKESTRRGNQAFIRSI